MRGTWILSHISITPLRHASQINFSTTESPLLKVTYSSWGGRHAINAPSANKLWKQHAMCANAMHRVRNNSAVLRGINTAPEIVNLWHLYIARECGISMADEDTDPIIAALLHPL